MKFTSIQLHISQVRPGGLIGAYAPTLNASKNAHITSHVVVSI